VSVLPSVPGVTNQGRTGVAAPHHSVTIKYADLATYGYGEFNVWVQANGKRKVSASSEQHIVVDKLTRPIRRVNYTQTSSVNKALKVAKSCLKDGLTTAVGTGAVGSPFVVFGLAIPGVGEVTTGGLAAVAGVAGGAASVSCFADNVL